MSATIYVWPTKKVPGAETYSDDGPMTKTGEPAPLFAPLALLDALTAHYRTDAHFVPYAVLGADGVPAPAPRVNKAAWAQLERDGVSITFGSAPLDFDDPVAHATGEPASDAWRDSFWSTTAPEIERLAGGRVIAYDTRGGARMVLVLPVALPTREYLELIAGLVHAAAQVGIAIDPLKDPQRCYRLPYVTRDGEIERRRVVLEGEVVTPRAINALRELGRAHPMVTPRTVDAPPRPSPSAGAAERIGDHVNSLAWSQILEPFGWRFLGMAGAQENWARPGSKKRPGDPPSAVTNYAGADLLHVFSTSAPALEAGRSYDKFGAFKALSGAADFRAARQLAAERFGFDLPIARPRVDCPELDDAMDRIFDRLDAERAAAKTSAAPIDPSEWQHEDALCQQLVISAQTFRARLDAGRIERRDDQGHDLYRVVDGSTPPPPPPPRLPMQTGADDDARFELGTEGEIAEELIAELEAGGGPRVVGDVGKLCRYEDGVWTEWGRASLLRRIHSFDGALVAGSKAPTKLRLSRRAMLAAIDQAQDFRRRPGYFDDAPKGIAFRNGFVRLSNNGTLTLEEHAPQHRQRAHLPFDYVADADPNAFHEFLGQVWAGEADLRQRIALLGEFVGASLTGEITKYEQALILLGSGSNGKSTLLQVIEACFARELIGSVPPQQWGHEYYRADLAWIRINVISEMPDVEIIDGETVKAVISGELIMARPIRESPFKFRPMCGHVMAANELPPVRDMSPGFWRRWVILTFPRSFEGAEKIIGLAEKLIEDVGTIASWALQQFALRKAAGGGLSTPSSSTAALATWRHEVDSVSQWCEERVIKVGVARTTATALYEDYRGWSAATGHRAVTLTKWGRRMALLGHDKARATDAVRYLLDLVKSPTPSAGGRGGSW